MGVAVATITLEVMDTSVLQMAHAVCKYYEKNNGIKENALIDLEELGEHINAYVKAEKKSLEVRKHE